MANGEWVRFPGMGTGVSVGRCLRMCSKAGVQRSLRFKRIQYSVDRMRER